jgi:alpha-galactosidase/6-phospho-beta-glucosidase family protein
LKIVIIGAGSYVFGPSVLVQTYIEQGLADTHLALVDPDLETIELLAVVGRRMARERGLATTVTTHADRTEALDGADFVICSASPQMQRRFAMDWGIIDQYIPGHLKTEFGGIAGISYSLRQIALIEAITDDMRRQCPNAWLLDVANPLPRVAQAAQENGIKTAGFCVASLSAYAMLWSIFHSEWLDYPFTDACERWQITTAGLNHFAWLVEFCERSTSEDLLPILRERLNTDHVGGADQRSQQCLRETGYLLVPGDEHTRDFLTPTSSPTDSSEVPWHGNPRQRQERLDLLRRIGEGTRSWDELRQGEAWEKPVQFIDALSGGTPAQFHAMNLLNDSRQITNLPTHVFVETPCHVSSGTIEPQTITLPNSVLSLCERTAHVTDVIVRAARERSRSLLHEAVRLDPTVLDKSAGIQAIDACLTAHSDMLPMYS